MPASSNRPARLLHALRLAVLRRRRLLAAGFVAIAVLSSLLALRAPTPATVSVLVAAHDLPAGATLAATDLRRVGWTPGTAPGGALSSDAAVGHVLAGPLRTGEPVTDVRLVGPELTAGDPALVATPVRLPDAGAAALLHVGDRIDLVAADPQGGSASSLAQDVAVLAMPDSPDQISPDGTSGRLVVLGLSPESVDAVSQAAVASVVTWTWTER